LEERERRHGRAGSKRVHPLVAAPQRRPRPVQVAGGLSAAPETLGVSIPRASRGLLLARRGVMHRGGLAAVSPSRPA
jgi:hypothetical protein